MFSMPNRRRVLRLARHPLLKRQVSPRARLSDGARPGSIRRMSRAAGARDGGNRKAQLGTYHRNGGRKGAILSFETAGMHATMLPPYWIGRRGGQGRPYCAQPLMERFGVASTTRASFALYNTHEEVDALISGCTRRGRFWADAMDESLRELYQEVILDHSRHPPPFRRAGGRHPSRRGFIIRSAAIA